MDSLYLSTFGERVFPFQSQDPQVSWEVFREEDEGKPSCLPGRQGVS